MKRKSGILFSVFSLPSEYGIEAFSNLLKNTGQTCCQVLTLGASGYKNTALKGFWTFFISLRPKHRADTLSEKRVVANMEKLLYNYQCYYCWKFGHCEPFGLRKSLGTGCMREV